jgi:hypothetical protein
MAQGVQEYHWIRSILVLELHFKIREDQDLEIVELFKEYPPVLPT